MVTTSVLTPLFLVFTPSFTSVLILLVFILRFLHCLPFYFTVHTLFVICIDGSYTDVISFGSYIDDD